MCAPADISAAACSGADMAKQAPSTPLSEDAPKPRPWPMPSRSALKPIRRGSGGGARRGAQSPKAVGGAGRVCKKRSGASGDSTSEASEFSTENETNSVSLDSNGPSSSDEENLVILSRRVVGRPNVRNLIEFWGTSSSPPSTVPKPRTAAEGRAAALAAFAARRQQRHRRTAFESWRAAGDAAEATEAADTSEDDVAHDEAAELMCICAPPPVQAQLSQCMGSRPFFGMAVWHGWFSLWTGAVFMGSEFRVGGTPLRAAESVSAEGATKERASADNTGSGALVRRNGRRMHFRPVGVVMWHGVLSAWTGAALKGGSPGLALTSLPFWLAGTRMLRLSAPQ